MYSDRNRFQRHSDTSYLEVQYGKDVIGKILYSRFELFFVWDAPNGEQQYLFLAALRTLGLFGHRHFQLRFESFVDELHATRLGDVCLRFRTLRLVVVHLGFRAFRFGCFYSVDDAHGICSVGLRCLAARIVALASRPLPHRICFVAPQLLPDGFHVFSVRDDETGRRVLGLRFLASGLDDFYSVYVHRWSACAWFAQEIRDGIFGLWGGAHRGVGVHATVPQFWQHNVDPHVRTDRFYHVRFWALTARVCALCARFHASRELAFPPLHGAVRIVALLVRDGEDGLVAFCIGRHDVGQVFFFAPVCLVRWGHVFHLGHSDVWVLHLAEVVYEVRFHRLLVWHGKVRILVVDFRLHTIRLLDLDAQLCPHGQCRVPVRNL